MIVRTRIGYFYAISVMKSGVIGGTFGVMTSGVIGGTFGAIGVGLHPPLNYPS